MWYLYNNLRVIYSQVVTAAHKAEPEYGDRPGEGAWV